MTLEDIQLRRDAYLRILTLGLIAIRDFGSFGRNPELCRIEADHLHNIPSLLDELNEHRHVFYAVQEKTLYLERVQALADQDYFHVTVERYKEPWTVLTKFALESQERINKELEQQLGQVSSDGAPSDEPSN